MGIRRVSWGEARREIKRACDQNPEVSYLTVFKDWREGFCQIWKYGEGYFVTRVDKEIDGDCLVICLMGGKGLLTWGYALEKDLQELAKAYHCRKIKVSGRKGWEKLLAPLGFKLQTIDMVKYVEQDENDRIHEYANEQARSAYGRPLVWRQRPYGDGIRTGQEARHQ